MSTTTERARAAARARWSRTEDRQAATSKARQAFLGQFDGKSEDFMSGYFTALGKRRKRTRKGIR